MQNEKTLTHDWMRHSFSQVPLTSRYQLVGAMLGGALGARLPSLILIASHLINVTCTQKHHTVVQANLEARPQHHDFGTEPHRADVWQVHLLLTKQNKQFLVVLER